MTLDKRLKDIEQKVQEELKPYREKYWSLQSSLAKFKQNYSDIKITRQEYDELNETITIQEDRSNLNPKKWIWKWFNEEKSVNRFEEVTHKLEELHPESYQLHYLVKQEEANNLFQKIKTIKQQSFTTAGRMDEAYGDIIRSAQEPNFLAEYDVFREEKLKEVLDIADKSADHLSGKGAQVDGLSQEHKDTLKELQTTEQKLNELSKLLDYHATIAIESQNLEDKTSILQQEYTEFETQINNLENFVIKTKELTNITLPESRTSLPTIIPHNVQPVNEISLFKQEKDNYYNATQDAEYFKINTFSSQLASFLLPYTQAPTRLDERIGEIATILQGKAKKEGRRLWKWSDRIEEIKNIYEENNLHYDANQQKDIARLKDIVDHNSYLCKKYSSEAQELSDLLISKNTNENRRDADPHNDISIMPIHEPIYIDDPTEHINEEAEQEREPIYTKQSKTYVQKGLQYVKRAIIPFVAGVALTALVYSCNPEKINQEQSPQEPIIEQTQTIHPKVDLEYSIGDSLSQEESVKNSNVTTNSIVQADTLKVKQGNTLWGLTKNYLQKTKAKITDKLIYTTVDNIAQANGKGKQADYAINSKDSKSPHYMQPGDAIIIPHGIEVAK